jgi:peptidoglycan hydrolase CwlO-like protein
MKIREELETLNLKQLQEALQCSNNEISQLNGELEALCSKLNDEEEYAMQIAEQMDKLESYET